MNENNNEEASLVLPVTNNRIKTLAECYNSAVANTSHIPLPQWKVAFDTRQQNIENKWKTKYEEAETRRKSQLMQVQKTERELADLERRHKLLNDDHNLIKNQLQDKHAKLEKLQTVSEKMYREYEALKSKHDVQFRVMQDAMKSASQWYIQNRELKRKSALLAQKFLNEAPLTITEISDEPDTITSSSDGELDSLLTTIKELTDEVGQLQAELNAARLQEFEAQEQAVSIAGELEIERTLRIKVQNELQELRTMRENLGRVSKLVATEMTALRELCQQEKEEAMRMKCEADKAQKERNILKHQSTLLLADVVGDEKVMLLLQEIEMLKRSLEEEHQRHAAELQEMQEKLEERESEAQLELLEEKLRLAESELQCALQRAEQAEKRSSQLISKVSQLQDELETKTYSSPPPPPPLPPPPSTTVLCPKIISSRSTATDTGSGNLVMDMANMLGIARKPSAVTALPGGAIDDIINQIKGGKFTLKATEKQKEKKEDPPAAVQEMLNILGTLKRRRKNSTHRSRWPPPADADVAL